jgi:hypothetical protein
MTTPNDLRPVDGVLQRQYAALAAATSAPHPSEDDWVGLADGALDEPSRLRLADHVTTCARCAAVFRAVMQVRDGAPALGAVLSPRASGGAEGVSRAWYGLALAATLVFAIAGAVWKSGGAGRPAAPGPVASAAPVSAPAAMPSATRPPASAVAARPRAWAALSTAPAITLPASLALVVRGAAPEAEAFMTAFGPAMKAYRDGRFDAAAVALDSVTRRYPDIAEGWFYLGASRLMAGDAAGALAPLERGRASTVLVAEARWLHAVALERAGRGPEADQALSAMCAADSPNRDRACAAAGVKP